MEGLWQIGVRALPLKVSCGDGRQEPQELWFDSRGLWLESRALVRRA
jgi:hypothetical protein